MDFFTEPMENQRETIIHEKNVTAFGLSLQGASHLERNPPVPCQDAHSMRWLDTEGILIAAIADGVGSCALSHWGAFTAVNSVLDSVQQSLEALAKGGRLSLSGKDTAFRSIMKDVMLEAFRTARRSVEALADNGTPPQPVSSFQSTLTLAIYDGTCLFHGHVGDDGIVAQLPDGTVEMATRRLKGEEANSVYPLQSGEQFWIFGVVPQVSGFVMATDGVLDAFVAAHQSQNADNYFNGICYSFIEKAIYTLADRKPGAPKRALEEYKTFMQSPDYRKKVNDDLTLIAVVSPKSIQAGAHPSFSMERWREAEETNRRVRQEALYGKKPVPEPQVPENSQVTEVQAPAFNSAGSHAIPVMKRILTTLLVLVSFAAGITLGRTLLAPVKAEEYEILEQTYSDLLEAKHTLDAELEALHQQLTEKDGQIFDLEGKADALTEAYAQLEKALEEARNELDEITEETEPEAAADETDSQGTESGE